MTNLRSGLFTHETFVLSPFEAAGDCWLSSKMVSEETKPDTFDYPERELVAQW